MRSHSMESNIGLAASRNSHLWSQVINTCLLSVCTEEQYNTTVTLAKKAQLANRIEVVIVVDRNPSQKDGRDKSSPVLTNWSDAANPLTEPQFWTYPRVLMKPLTEPSAYRETISPMCRKLDIESDIFGSFSCFQKQLKKLTFSRTVPFSSPRAELLGAPCAALPGQENVRYGATNLIRKKDLMCVWTNDTFELCCSFTLNSPKVSAEGAVRRSNEAE